MGDIHYAKDLPGWDRLPPLDSLTDMTARGVRGYRIYPAPMLPNSRKAPPERRILVTQELFDRIGDYTRSQPTGPSPGRVYRKDLHWSESPSNWFVYFCERAPDDRGVDHHPYRVEIVTQEVIDQNYRDETGRAVQEAANRAVAEQEAAIEEIARNASGVALIEVERTRQRVEHGYDVAHDATHDDGSLIAAARCYLRAAAIIARAPSAQASVRRVLDHHGVDPYEDADYLAMVADPVGHYFGWKPPEGHFDAWPWEAESWRPSNDPVRMLVKAGALIAAEIDRLRAAVDAAPEQEALS